ncbi:MAG: hypothetical protein WCA35_26035 [Kovacikia sp.]
MVSASVSSSHFASINASDASQETFKDRDRRVHLPVKGNLDYPESPDSDCILKSSCAISFKEK